MIVRVFRRLLSKSKRNQQLQGSGIAFAFNFMNYGTVFNGSYWSLKKPGVLQYTTVSFGN